tara:strand:+ start:938 stop:1105 length:168 start_codon:yes stop_codon:yes gene_type:complete
LEVKETTKEIKMENENKVFEYYVSNFTNDLGISRKEAIKRLTQYVTIFEKYSYVK